MYSLSHISLNDKVVDEINEAEAMLQKPPPLEITPHNFFFLVL